MNTQKKARSLYWDIVKGWGIIAIVLGHTGYFAGAFVYLFHLALFFFITGYFYNETKYGDSAPVSPVHGPGICSTRCFLSCFTTFL
jgi:hypothetical protein